MALSAITSIGSAFAFSPAGNHKINTYYAVRTANAGDFVWTMNQPTSPLGCKATVLSATCIIQTANQPTDNEVPSGHTVTNQVYR